MSERTPLYAHSASGSRGASVSLDNLAGDPRLEPAADAAIHRVWACAETGGFTEFVPLPFVHMEAPMYLRGMARKGPTLREAVLMHAVGRLVLHPLITNIQTSWVKMGPEGAAMCLNAGANDMGGTLMNESISRAAGTQHGQEFPPEAMERLVQSIGRLPMQRSTAYGPVSNERQVVSFGAPELAPVVQTPPRKVLVGE